MAKVTACDVPECDRPIWSRGACRMHYQRAYTGDATVTLRPVSRVNAGKPCAIDGCGKPARKLTWCHMHYQRWRQHGDPFHEKADPPKDCIKCSAEKIRNASGKMYCQACASDLDKARRASDPEGVREQQRASYRRNINTYRAWQQRYYAANREQIIAQSAEYLRLHPEVKRKAARAWAAKNPDRMSEYAAQRRARKLNAVCKHGPKCVPWNAWAGIADQMCVYCGDSAAHADHYIPLARGGLHCIQNIVPACATCNRSKGSRLPDEWAEMLRRKGVA